MSDFLRGGISQKLADVTELGRLRTVAVNIPFSGALARANRLYSIGTGSITPTSGGERSVLWMRNDDNDNDYVVTDLIFGSNGGSTTNIKTFFSLIYYNTGEPSANHTAINAESENIKFATADGPATLNNFTGYKWDGASTGMTSGSGGFAKIPNRIGKGNVSLDIAGEIVLGKGNSMEFRVTPEETGLFQVSVVFGVVPITGYEEVL